MQTLLVWYTFPGLMAFRTLTQAGTVPMDQAKRPWGDQSFKALHRSGVNGVCQTDSQHQQSLPYHRTP